MLTGVVLLAALTGAVLFARQYSRPSKTGAQAPAVSLKIKGNRFAAVTVEIFSDFECPACRLAMAEEAKILADYPEKVRFVFYHFPLSSHRLSPVAHQAAECAALQGRFWPYHDRLYDQQETWTVRGNPVETFIEYARETGLDLDRFAACLSDPRVARDIQNDRRYGDALQVSSTPTFFVNGERFIGSVELAKGGVERIGKLLEEKSVGAAS